MRTFHVMYNHTLSCMLANHQIRHHSTRKVSCQLGDCRWPLNLPWGLCKHVWVNRLTLSHPRLHYSYSLWPCGISHSESLPFVDEIVMTFTGRISSILLYCRITLSANIPDRSCMLLLAHITHSEIKLSQSNMFIVDTRSTALPLSLMALLKRNFKDVIQYGKF